MRMLMKVTLDVAAANAAIKDGRFPKTMQGTVEETKPEAAYFTTQGGKRTAFFFFDMKDVSQMPMLAEPWFMNLHADVEFSPVMNSEDLKKGLETVAKRL